MSRYDPPYNEHWAPTGNSDAARAKVRQEIADAHLWADSQEPSRAEAEADEREWRRSA